MIWESSQATQLKADRLRKEYQTSPLGIEPALETNSADTTA